MNNEKEDTIHFRCSKKMKQKLNELSQKTKLNQGPLMIIAVYRLFEEMEYISESLTEINKDLTDFCDIIDKRYANFAFSSLKSTIKNIPHEDRLEIHLAIQKQINKKKLSKKEDFDYLSSLKF